jgi:hypothetical protein
VNSVRTQLTIILPFFLRWILNNFAIFDYFFFSIDVYIKSQQFFIFYFFAFFPFLVLLGSGPGPIEVYRAKRLQWPNLRKPRFGCWWVMTIWQYPNPAATPILHILLSKSGTITLDQIEHLHFKWNGEDFWSKLVFVIFSIIRCVILFKILKKYDNIYY